MTRSEKIKTTGGTSTSLKVLARLAEDEDRDVRCSVAGNPSTPPEVLLILMVDDYESVRGEAERRLNRRLTP